MNSQKIVAELEEERDRLNQALALLKERIPAAVRSERRGNHKVASAPLRRGLTAAGRKRLSELMKKRWADRRKSI